MHIEKGVVRRDDRRFPRGLLAIVPEVEALYYRGHWRNDLFDRCVAVVGARKISRYGKQVIEELAPRLVEAGYTVISGFMYGVDIEVHSKVLVNGGCTVAVLGHGIDYPIDPQNSNLYHKFIDSNGLFVSEWETRAPKPYTYVLRNRIVVGLSQAVIVVEADVKSGSLRSAAWGKKLGKKVFAVPGSIFSPVSRGTNSLVDRGEAAILTWESLHAYMGTSVGNNYSVNDWISQAESRLTASEKTIVTLLTLEGPLAVNEVSRRLNISVGEVTALLTSLYMRGRLSEERGVWRAEL